ncbi:PhoX family phosphatase [Thioalkalivibrio sp. XN279]|uniref:PhoX family protein n=1 Tax=Thioalkalivibrio sp. XN279 TaxID=2714953 RepID=UPI00140DE47C|nr:PhoX family phosphatase [Thioalkalivibrio sp. XN279]NHA14182.1 PhoX family phosphatase [Thioalkalivibrio sp. XN279]
MHDHDNGVSNPSKNRPFRDVLEVSMSRRKMMMGSLATAATAYVASSSVALAAKGGLKGPNAGKGGSELIGFKPVTLEAANVVDSGKMPLISPDYEYQTLISWGEKLYPSAPVTPYEGDPNTRPTGVEQELLIGIGHDGMTFFPKGGKSNTEGMLAINHEFGNNFHVLGKGTPATLNEVRASQHAHGVSVVALQKIDGTWQQVDSPNARRIHVNTPVEFSGPVAGHELLKTPKGNPTLGTVNNCSNGETPWGTYLTCEENFNGYFGAAGEWVATPRQARYGFSRNGFGYGWHLFDERFDLSNPDYANEENRFGWVVEIDPNDGTQTPVKRTALGRFKHEGAEVTVGRGGRMVVYMGDDERFDYIYKFVSDDNWKSMRARGLHPLDHGKLYVAKFNDDGTGNWLELTIKHPALAASFKDQAEVLTFARLAADVLGATPMDRPEWASVAPNGDVYCTLTNNSRRTVPDAANPLAPNNDGHIIRWRDDDQHVGTSFVWDIFLIAETTHRTEQSFSDPDGIWVDPDGRVFIQTDGGQKDGLRNQMLVADAEGKEIRRLFVGLNGDEITGIAYTPDRRTMFINTQHPGNGNPELTNFPANPGTGKIPRDTTFVITKKDGGIIGS